MVDMEVQPSELRRAAEQDPNPRRRALKLTIVSAYESLCGRTKGATHEVMEAVRAAVDEKNEEGLEICVDMLRELVREEPNE